MSREVHVRFCESRGVRFPPATHPGFERPAHRLAAITPVFADLWARHEVHDSPEGHGTVDTPDVGELAFEYTLLPLPDRPGSRICLLSPKPGTMTGIPDRPAIEGCLKNRLRREALWFEWR